MGRKSILLLAALFLSLSMFGQMAVTPLELVQEQKALGKSFEKISLTDQLPNVEVDELRQKEADYAVLSLNYGSIDEILASEPDQFLLSVPYIDNTILEIELVKVNLFADEFSVVAASKNEAVDVDLGLHYRGIIKNDKSSIAAVSIFKGELMGLLSSSNFGNLVLGKLDGPEYTEGEHVIYNDHKILHDFDLDCGTEDDGAGYTHEELIFNPSRDPGDCVQFYYEVDNDIYNDKGGMTGTTNYITGLTNQVATLYSNESINTVISQLFIWDTSSPYTGGSSSQMLSQFQSNTNNWPGTLAQLLSYQSSGGVAAGFSGICASNEHESMSFSSIQSSYNVVPTYSWSVMVVTHEFGHTFGSRHTHACVWNGNNTAIDGCSGSTEGSCSLPGNPSQGGTIMSYCHLQSVGINFNEGFGPQPGNVIRNSVANGTCMSPCGPPSCTDGIQNGDETGVDCGGPDCPACPSCDDGILNGDEIGIDCGGPDCAPCPCSNNLTLTITLDNYPEETSWDVRDASNNVWASGSYSTANPDGSTVTESICVPDGCYDFTIYDSYGDGICCSYGNGSYTLTNDADGTTLASGGSFGSSETTNFCVTAGTGPTCSDGIQNGNETGVDCGGPDCPACPSCDTPGGLSATPATTEATLTWNPVSGATNYNIRARAVGTTTWTDGPNLNSPVSYTGLTACTDYEFQVQTNCSNGLTSAWSASSTFTTTGCTGCTYSTINSNDFEGGWGIWNDGGSDCRRSANDASYANGTYCVRLRDNTSTSVMTTDNLSLASYSELTVDFSYYPRSMDNSNEDFWLQVSTDGGSTYTTVEEWNRGDEFENNQRYDDSVVIPGPFTGNTRLRFRCDASGNSDWVYIDDVVISGCSSGGALVPNTDDIDHSNMVEANIIEAKEPITAVNLFPNPTNGLLTVKFATTEAMTVQMAISDLSGQMIQTRQFNADLGLQEVNVDASRLNSGIYFMHIISAEGKVSKKFVVIE
jgi:hypothetical protein